MNKFPGILKKIKIIYYSNHKILNINSRNGNTENSFFQNVSDVFKILRYNNKFYSFG